LCSNFDSSEDHKENRFVSGIIQSGGKPCPPGKFRDQKLKTENYQTLDSARKLKKSKESFYQSMSDRKIVRKGESAGPRSGEIGRK
jgi:phosphoribosyl-AMP cyclohydrolase